MTPSPEDSRRDLEEESLEELQNRLWQVWAHNYDGYRRFAGPADQLHSVLRPAWDEFEQTGRVPSWCGVDFLRAWAFYMARGNHWSNGDEYERAWRPVLFALADHPHASGNDIPPMVVDRF